MPVRHLYGGGPADVVEDAAGNRSAGTRVYVFTDPALTVPADVRAADGTALASGLLTDDVGAYVFQGPEDYSGPLYVATSDDGGLTFLAPSRLDPADMAARLTAVETAGTNAAEDLAAETTQRQLGDTANAQAIVDEVARAAGVENGKVGKAGDTMTGPLVLPGNAVSPLQAVPKQQLDAAQTAAQAYADGLITALKAGVNPAYDTLLELAAELTSDTSGLAALTIVVGTKATALTRTAVKTANYTAGVNEMVPVDTTSGPVTVTLPAAPVDKTRVLVKHIIQGGVNAATVACSGSDVLNKTGGATTVSLPLLAQAVTVQYDLATHVWTIQSDDLPLSQLDLRFAAADITAHYVSGAWRVPAGPHPWNWLVPPSGPWPTAGDGYNAAVDSVNDPLMTNPHGLATRAETTINATISTTMTTGTAFGCLFIPERNVTASKLWCMAGATVTAVLTVCKLGLFTVAGNGDITLVARTAHDTALIAANADKSSPLSTVGGFPATYNLLRGTTYALVFLPVFASGSLIMRGDFGPLNVNPMSGFTLSAPGDLPTGTTAAASLTRNGGRLWMAAEA